MNKYIENLDLDPTDAFVLKFNKLSKCDFECDYLDGLDFDETESKNIYNNRLRHKNLVVFNLVHQIDTLNEKLCERKRSETELILESIIVFHKELEKELGFKS